MTRPDRLKRDLVREVVRENLETMRGLPPRPLRRSRRLPRRALRGAGLLLAPSLLFVAISALSTREAERPGLSPAATRPGTAQTELAARHESARDPGADRGPAPNSEAASFPAPRPISPAAFPLAVRKVVLDPGHGGSDPGARTPFGQWEKEITLDVARRLRSLLQEAGLEVAMTRDADETVSLRERALLANAARGDVFVSIHFNALPVRRHRGIETYFLGPTDDPQVERLAGWENRDSGYSLADFRRLLEGVYTHVRQADSRQFAQTVHRTLLAALTEVSPGIKDGGVKPAPFVVLVATEMPGILAEVSYLSNEDDARLLADPEYRQRVARALAAGIRAYAQARGRSGRSA